MFRRVPVNAILFFLAGGAFSVAGDPQQYQHEQQSKRPAD